MRTQRFKIRCPKCNVGLLASETSVGKRKKCPQCQAEFEVQRRKESDTDEIPLPATDEQKKRARELGLVFPLDTSTEDLEELIADAAKKRSVRG